MSAGDALLLGVAALVPVALLSSSPIVMAAPAGSPYKSFADVVAAAKANPDGITLGYSPTNRIGSRYVEVTVIGSNGRLMK
mgnify:CR=1 FL=1